jgi:hypothetical protein
MVFTTHFFCHRVADTYSYRQEHLRSHRLLSQILWSCRLLALYWSLVAVDLRIASNEDGGLYYAAGNEETKRTRLLQFQLLYCISPRAHSHGTLKDSQLPRSRRTMYGVIDVMQNTRFLTTKQSKGVTL